MIRLQREKFARYCLIAFWVIVTFAKLIQASVLLYPAIAIAMIGMYFGSDSLRCGFSLMLVPNIRMFDGLGTTFLVNILLFMPLISKIIHEKRINGIALLHTALLAALELVHVIALQNYNNLIPNMVTVFTLLYVETVLLDFNSHLNFARIARMFSFGCIYSAVVFFIIRSRRMDMSIYFNGLGYRYQGYASDPNYFSLYMCLAVAMLFIVRAHKKRDIIYIFALIFIELMTFSKMALVVLMLTILYFAGKAIWHGFAGRLRFVKYFLLAGIGLAVVFSNRIVSFLEVTFSRLQQHNGSDVNLDTITSSRSTLMGFYLSSMFYDPLLPLFGYGLQYNELYLKNLSHNTFLDVVLSWGVIGLALMVVIFTTLIRRLVAACPEKVTVDHLFPLFVLFLTFFALSCLSASMFWWVVLAALLPLKGIENEEEPENLRNRTGIQRQQVSVGMH